MTIEESVPLATLTTLRVGGPARYVISIKKPADLPEAVAFAAERSLPITVLGGGSNVLAPDAGYAGVVLHMQLPGISFADAGAAVLVTAGAGASWDVLVEKAVARGLWGIENLAGIPGTVGAAPVQNIGAYGMELEQVFVSADVYDRRTGEVRPYMHNECAFEYRQSRFKSEPELIITSVTLELKKDGSPQLQYGDLAARAAVGEPLGTPAAVAAAVRSIRARKFPDLAVCGTAGSFFKNPIISEEKYTKLAVRFGDITEIHGAIPRYPLQREGEVKIPLAYILDKVLGMRGYRIGPVHLFNAQPLVLVADEGATQQDIDALANDVAQKVFEATGIAIEREVRNIA
ncbi:MAG TPA: UDP-N-acetylmuramate dehydrogenase [Candidatus Paceibacterota bacterium]|nr:UDP-N-acetylmuramate dehydrogenase [Candidatus Paceibacterota bacterium]